MVVMILGAYPLDEWLLSREEPDNAKDVMRVHHFLTLTPPPHIRVQVPGWSGRVQSRVF